VPTAFGLKNYIILTPLLLYSWFYFYEKNRFLFYFFFISILGLIIYSFSIIVFKNYSFVSTQWFKTTIWLKLLSSIVLILAIAKFDFLVFFPKRKLNTAYIFPFIAIFSIGIMMRPFSFFKNKDYHFPFSSYQSSETDIALLAKANTPITAQFLTPASCTAFKYHSERGSYIDFKAVTHSKDAFGTWYERVQEVYRIGGKNATIKGLAATKLADENFARLTENDFLELKKKGVTHLLCEKKQALNFTKIVENQDFIIYELEDKR
jgi:hypothetical protein